jgi:putative addiction module killer protein
MDIRKTHAFDLWLKSLRDTRGRAKVLVRVERLAMGNPGDVASIGQGCSELRIHDGPGYRVYFRQEQDGITLLLGGDKATQAEDIAKAKALAKQLKE